MRRLGERFKQTVYMAHETYYGSGEYNQPLKYRVLVKPMREGVISGGGIENQYNTVELQIETRVKNTKKITENTKVWINKIPDEAKLGRDSNYKVIGTNVNTTGYLLSIGCRSFEIGNKTI